MDVGAKLQIKPGHRVRESLAGQGVQPVRQVAVHDVWSVLRFRPA